MASLNSIIPGLTSLNSGASDLIKQLMSGNLSTGVRKSIYDAGAERGVLGGMPGSSARGGSLFANADLRNIGRSADDQQQRGFQDLLALIANASGTQALTPGQELQDQQFQSNLGFQQNQADRANQLAKNADARAWGEYDSRYGPRREFKGSYVNGNFTTDLWNGVKGFDEIVYPTGQRLSR